MYKKQLGRRNLTDEQRTFLLGKMYEARKKSVGNPATRDSKGRFQLDQNGPIGKASNPTAKSIATELGVGQTTVKRAEKFAKGIDALSEVSKEAAGGLVGAISAEKF